MPASREDKVSSFGDRVVSMSSLEGDLGGGGGGKEGESGTSGGGGGSF